MDIATFERVLRKTWIHGRLKPVVMPEVGDKVGVLQIGELWIKYCNILRIGRIYHSRLGLWRYFNYFQYTNVVVTMRDG